MQQTDSDPMPNAYHYAVIARAIAVIDAAPQPLALPDLATQMGMSVAHFQRVFTQWVGVSPKRYQQYLTLGHAKALLATRNTVLDTAVGTGLSGASRLHDLFVRWEAMSPGDYARGGADLTLGYGVFDTIFGPALAVQTERGLCGLGFLGDAGLLEALNDMQARWPAAQMLPDDSAAQRGAAAFAASTTQPQNRPTLHLIGAPFQIKVWEALLAIPPGQVTTYGQIAAAIGSPKAVRAVGTAVGRNPIGWVIPCHRTLRKSGALGGYHWGLPIKRAMLAWEAVRADHSAPPPTGTTIAAIAQA